MMVDKPLTDAQKRVLQAASQKKQATEPELGAQHSTVQNLIKRGYLERVRVFYGEIQYRITEAGRAALVHK